MSHVAPTAVAPNYSNPVQPSIPTHSIAAIYACHWLDHRWSNHLTAYIDITAYSSPNGKWLICYNIILGEFINFSVLLHRATFLDAATKPLPSTQQPIKRLKPLSCECRPGTCSYLSLTLSHNPTKVLKPLTLQNWHHYDAKFRTLAAVNPFFCWDQRHPYLWLECLIRSSNAGCAPYCKATTHFPDNCPQSSFRDSKSTHTPFELENPFHLYVASSTKIAAPEPPVTANTSAYPVKATSLESTATKTRVNLPGNDNPASSLPPNIKCDNVDRQLQIYCRPQGSLTWISVGG